MSRLNHIIIPLLSPDIEHVFCNKLVLSQEAVETWLYEQVLELLEEPSLAKFKDCSIDEKNLRSIAECLHGAKFDDNSQVPQSRDAKLNEGKSIREMIFPFSEEPQFKDFEIIFSDGNIHINSFIMCLLSPVLRKIVCGQFSESCSRQLQRKEDQKCMFETAFSIALGAEINAPISDVFTIAMIADTLEMTSVLAISEESLSKILDVETCADILSRSQFSGLATITRRSLALALSDFFAVAETAGFLRLSDSILEMLLSDETLIAGNEEFPFKILMAWSTHQKDNSFLTVFTHIRFQLMSLNFLDSLIKADSICGQSMLAEIKELASKAAQTIRTGILQQDEQEMLPRLGAGFPWKHFRLKGEYILGRSTSLGDSFTSVAVCRKHICGALYDGRIIVWDRRSLGEDTSLSLSSDAAVLALVGWKNFLVSGDANCTLKVWNLDQGSGKLKCTYSCHKSAVVSLLVSGKTLISNSICDIKVWEFNQDGILSCKHTLEICNVVSVALWENKLITGTADVKNPIKIWDACSGVQEHALTLGQSSLRDLLVTRDRLVCVDLNTIYAWTVNSWEVIAFKQVYEPSNALHFNMLAESGGRVISTAYDVCAPGHQIKVWEVERLVCEDTIETSGFAHAYVDSEGEIWGAIDDKITLWRL